MSKKVFLKSSLQKKMAAEEYFDFVGSIILVLDSKGEVEYINKRGCNLLELDKKDILGKNWIENFVPTDISKDIEGLRANILDLDSEDEKKVENENPIVTASGKIRMIKWSNTVLENENGNVTGTFSSGEDITDALLYEQQLENSKIQLTKAEEIAEVGSWVMDIKTGAYVCSDGFLRICGYEPGECESDYSNAMKATHPDDLERIEKIIRRSIESGEDYEFENRIVRPDGQIRHVRSKGTYIKDKDGKVVNSIGTLLDITDLKRQFDEIEYMYHHDSLTGLYNRRYFDDKFAQIDSIGNYPISIIVADINGLKMVNDTKGHIEGDKMIARVATLLESVCEEGDILSRTGGDDFILLLPRTIESQAEIVMNDLHDMFVENDGEEALSVSMGLAVKSSDDTSKEDLVKEAEDNMYTSKLYEKSSKRGDMLQLIMDALYERSNREEMHSERVSQYCRQMAEALRLPAHKVNELSALGLLHDIGKIAVRDSVLNKPGRLNNEEWEEIKRHPETGFRILNNAPGMREASNYILAHHERWDGNGYPNGIASYDIPLQARIIAIADAFDAMRSKRPYKDPLPLEVAVSEIKKGAGTQFDPKLAKVFIMEVLKCEW